MKLPELRPISWKMPDFAIFDNNGYILEFGQVFLIKNDNGLEVSIENASIRNFIRIC